MKWCIRFAYLALVFAGFHPKLNLFFEPIPDDPKGTLFWFSACVVFHTAAVSVLISGLIGALSLFGYRGWGNHKVILSITAVLSLFSLYWLFGSIRTNGGKHGKSG